MIYQHKTTVAGHAIAAAISTAVQTATDTR
jgi:hypothetical protein